MITSFFKTFTVLALSALSFHASAAVVVSNNSLNTTVAGDGDTNVVINDPISLSAASNNYILFGSSARGGGTGFDITNVDITIDGGSAQALTKIDEGIGNNGSSELWGLALGSLSATTDIDFSVTFDSNQNGSVLSASYFQLTSASNPVSVLEHHAGSPNSTLTFAETLTTDDAVVGIYGSRDTGPEEDWDGSLGTPTADVYAVDNWGGTGQTRHGYWDNTSGTNLTMSMSSNNSNGGIAGATFTAVPEPGTLALTGLALVAALAFARKRG